MCFLHAARRTTSSRSVAMGWGDVKHLRVWNAFEDSLDDARFTGKRVGIDLYVYLHIAIASREGSDQQFSLPRVPVVEVERVLQSLVNALAVEGRNITPVFVLDGQRNPAKAAEDAARAAQTKTKEDALQEKLIERRKSRRLQRGPAIDEADRCGP